MRIPPIGHEHTHSQGHSRSLLPKGTFNAQVSCEQRSEGPVLVGFHLIVERPRSPTRGHSSVAGYYAPLTREEGRDESAPWRLVLGSRVLDMPQAEA
jgi:hypothetical protein